MSQLHRLQQRRFELKYLVDEAITPALRDFVSSYLVLDEYGLGRTSLSYPVHSLYLDSDDLDTFEASVNGTKNRFKLRLRYYDDAPTTPVFFEVKSRVDNCILKQRCAVRRPAIPALLSGQFPEPDQLFSDDPAQVGALHQFILLLCQLGARPKLHNSYLREAWVSPDDDSVRVTLDRKIQAERWFCPEAVLDMRHPCRVFREFVVLELKFTARFPNWFTQLVRKFNLMQFSSAKYAEGVILMGRHRFHDGYRLAPASEFATQLKGEWQAAGAASLGTTHAAAEANGESLAAAAARRAAAEKDAAGLMAATAGRLP